MSPPQPTRLLLSNLPASLTSDSLRSHIQTFPSAPPVITDCKILLKKDGTSRRIAFVGFKQSEEAESVKEWLNGSWLTGTRGGGRIKADWAKDAADTPPPRKRVKVQEHNKPIKDEDTRFLEFMALMGPKKNKTRDELNAVSEVVKEPVALQPEPAQEEELVKEPSPETIEPQAPLEEPVFEKDAAIDDDAVSDMEYMTRRMKRKLEIEQDVEEDGMVDEAQPKKWIQEEEQKKETPTEVEEPVDPTTAQLESYPRLFIRNLAFSTTTEELESLLSPFGPLTQVHIPIDTNTQSSKGLAYATFQKAEDALAALQTLDGKPFQGRLLHVLPAIQRNEKTDYKQLGVKATKAAQKKSDASKNITWATLFMNADAVVNAIAERLSIDKSALLDPNSDNAAVRVALAETHIISETKQYFQDKGINLECFSPEGYRGPRSSTTILVKNLPFDTTEKTLRTMFNEYGDVGRVLLPPSGTMGIVEMENDMEAARAWKGLVYKKIGSSVLYLEKAPLPIWDGAPPSASTTANSKPNKEQTGKTETIADPSQAGSVLYIKNLNFQTTQETLIRSFSHFDDFVFARIQMKPDPKRPGQKQSMGYGFVGFKTVEAANVAMSSKQGALLEGHKLEIKFAQRGKEDNAVERKEKSSTKSTKLIAKNIPFEASKKDIYELFGSFGQLKSVRLPKKLDRKTRGFAFLEFNTHAEAENAKTALEHTHLLGRHIVLQWANEGAEEVEQIRKKVKAGLDGKVGGKKEKFTMEEKKRKRGDDEDDE